MIKPDDSALENQYNPFDAPIPGQSLTCLLYTSDAADE